MDNANILIEKKINKKPEKIDKNEEQWKNIIIISFIIILGTILIIILVRPVILDIEFNYKIIKSDNGFQYILVNWTSNDIFNISINVKGVENEIIRTYNIFNTNKNEQLVKVYFGIPELNIIIEKDGVKNEKNENFKISAKEIVIAALHATLPTLIFSFDIFNIINNYNCPIYVSLERYNAWDWDKLPQRILIFDILDKNDFNINFDSILRKLQKWMKQMFIVNPKVIFNLFITDFHNFIVPLCIYSNNIPSDNYRIYLLSDGTGSYQVFNELYDNKETYINTYNQLKDKFLKFKSYVLKRKYYDKNKNLKNSNYLPSVFNYIYIMVKEEKNVFWWLTKIKGVFVPNNPILLDELLNNPNITLKELNYLFRSLNKEQKVQVKNLFNFNSNYFEEAYKLNKSVMLIAGTHDIFENNLKDYCLATKLFYNDEYVYYYKAHPQTPIENKPKRIDNLKQIGVIPIDSNIPLEIIMFFINNISYSGYYSSSFIELEKEKLKALFVQNEKEEDYFNKFDFSCQFIKKDNEKYGKYLENNDNAVILEINKKKVVNLAYDFGVYLKNYNSIIYYKYN